MLSCLPISPDILTFFKTLSHMSASEPDEPGAEDTCVAVLSRPCRSCSAVNCTRDEDKVTIIRFCILSCRYFLLIIGKNEFVLGIGIFLPQLRVIGPRGDLHGFDYVIFYNSGYIRS